ISGLLTINAGGIVDDCNCTGKTVVNSGGPLQGYGHLGDVDVYGEFSPFETVVYGTLRMLSGSTFRWEIVDAGATGSFATYVYITGSQPAQLTNCTLAISVPNSSISPGTLFGVIEGAGASGTFNSLPEGGRLIISN